MNLRSELDQLADTAPRPTLDQTLWDRGRALRRRDRLMTSAVVIALVVIVGGLASLVVGPPRSFEPAGDPAPEGAIPSAIHDVLADTELPLETDLAVGRASVAFYSEAAIPVVINASDGRYHLLDLPRLAEGPPIPSSVMRGVPGPLALSPDGTRLAWRSTELVHVLDLRSGKVTDLEPLPDESPTVSQLTWNPDSLHLMWSGRSLDGKVAGEIDVTTSAEQEFARRDFVFLRGAVSPSRSLVALPAGSLTDSAVPFLSVADSRRLQRTLPVDLYPAGAGVGPLGWADDDLVLATVAGGQGSYVEGVHLAVFTSPDRPESEWTYRILVRNLPDDVYPTIAVDLIPDLDGTSNQQLTHDFGQPGQRDISWMIGLGVAAAVAVLLGVRWLWRRRTFLR